MSLICFTDCMKVDNILIFFIFCMKKKSRKEKPYLKATVNFCVMKFSARLDDMSAEKKKIYALFS